jgi:hypothetical protein
MHVKLLKTLSPRLVYDVAIAIMEADEYGDFISVRRELAFVANTSVECTRAAIKLSEIEVCVKTSKNEK